MEKEKNETNKETIIYFPQGIPGFEEYKRYVIYLSEEFSPFKILKSIDNDELNVKFIIVETNLIKPDYKIELTDLDREDLRYEDGDVVQDFFIVTIDPKNYKNSYINLMGPLVINFTKELGKQLIIDRYIEQPLYYFLKEEENSK